MKDFWLFFFRNPKTGLIRSTICGHNAIADYRGHPYFIGMKKIKVNVDKLEGKP